MRVSKKLRVWVSLFLIIIITAWNSPLIAIADDRLFLNLSLEFLGEYQLPKQDFEQTGVGGLSAIAYDQKRDCFYALSDDRSLKNPARFYTLKMSLKPSIAGDITLDRVTVEKVTFFRDKDGNLYSPYAIDPEGLAFSPRDTLFISTEGNVKKQIDPFIAEFNLETGRFIQTVPLPKRFLFHPSDQSLNGVRENRGFEALTIGKTSILRDDPFRLFASPEYSLSQDIPTTSDKKSPLRWLHYVINPIGEPVLISEQVYLLEPAPLGTLLYGLSELVTLPKEGYWLSLERIFGVFGFQAKIFQVVTADATDTSRILKFQGDLSRIKPLYKKLLLNLPQKGIEIDNLEGMTIGPILPDGSPSLVLVSDNNFKAEEITQFLLFRLKKG